MCGIAISYESTNQATEVIPANEVVVARMLGRLRHRGPDGSGLAVRGGTVLGQTRLAIVDVAGGRQPIADASSRNIAVGNGEIYNHAALRRRFSGDFNFQTRSDTEVVLPVFQRLGAAGAGVLDGMFSVAVSDGKDFIAARDPLGIKPLYYGQAGSALLFASEICALADEVDEVVAFPPGHCYTPEAGLVPYYQVPRRTGVVVDPEEAMRMVREALTAAVRSHLMSDVPVGAFLSGGLDSSLLAMLARREVQELHTFAVGMEGSEDLAAAETVAQAIGSRHHAFELTPAMIAEAVEPVVLALESYDAALVRSAVPTWFVARCAAGTHTAAGERIKVVLTGEGADELFAGYDYLASFHGNELEDELSRLLGSLHNMNLQRVDRMTMAHSLEARVPFLSTEFVEKVMSIHPLLRENGSFGQAKGLLRKAFEGALPPEIIWRKKAEFAQGSSVSECLGALASSRVSDERWAQAQRHGLPVASREELFYFDILRQRLRTPLRAGTMGRWQGPVL